MTNIDQATFRQALSHFASGVTVVTTQHAGCFHGTTISSFCSLSLKPPLVLICIGVDATINELIAQAKVFGVNILSQQGEQLSRQFALHNGKNFSHIPIHLGQNGIPLLDDALATIECKVSESYPGGDHTIFVGEVISIDFDPDKQPLLYFRSKYQQLKDLSVNLRV